MYTYIYIYIYIYIEREITYIKLHQSGFRGLSLHALPALALHRFAFLDNYWSQHLTQQERTHILLGLSNDTTQHTGACT